MLNAPSSKNWRTSNKNTETSIENLLRLYRRNERGLGINEETALLSPLQWRFEVDRMQSRFASSVDMGPCRPAKFWRKSFVYYLKAVALIGLRGHGRGGKLSLVAEALSKIDAGWLCSYGRLVWRLFFLLGKAGYVYLLSLLCGCFHVVEIGRVPSMNNIRSVSTMTTADSAVCTFYLETKILFTGRRIFFVSDYAHSGKNVDA